MIRLRILIVSRIYPNQYNSNGRVFHSQTKELIKKGFEVKVIAPIPITPKYFKNQKSLWKEYSMLPKEDLYDGVEIYYPRYIKIPNILLNNPLRTFSEKSLTNAIINTINKKLQNFNFDLVHCHMTYPDSLIGQFIKEKYNVPFIVSARSSDLDISINNKITRNKMAQVYTIADAIITPSPPINRKLKNNFNMNSILIGNGVYSEELENIENIESPDKTSMILSISVLIKSKGIQDNIRAMSKLVKEFPGIQYIIIGDGDYKKELIELTKSLDLTNNVKFLGSQEHYKAMQYMKNCDIFSLPSSRETFGLVYLEAMYYNKPIILCQNQGIDGVVKDNESCKLVNPNSSEEVYEAIKGLLQNKKIRDDISKRGNEIVRKHYTWEEIGNKLKTLYLSLHQ